MRLPTTLEVRRRIEQVGDSVHPTEDKRVAKDVDEYQLRMAMEYQYLVAGRVSEIAGKYQPGTNLAYPVYINDIESVLFPVKTANYLYVEIDESPYALLMLLRPAENFIRKLCVPFDKLHSMTFEQFLIKSRIHLNEGGEE